MSDEKYPPPLAEPEVTGSRRFPVIWLIPLVAALIAGWLVYAAYSSEGPTITVSFETAEGIEAGKTKLKYKDVEIGLVTDVRLSDDFTRITLTAEMEPAAEQFLREATQFWVVRPRLTAAGVSGLGTLVSGAYLTFDPGEGEPRRDFVGLEEPPIVTSDVPGRRFVLRSDKLGTMGTGAPIFYRGIEVGEVLGHRFDPVRQELVIPIFVRDPFAKFVREDSLFWNASGFDIEFGADGINASIESLEALLLGGIEFETPSAFRDLPGVEAETEFRLYASRSSAKETTFTQRIPYLLYFNGSVRGLKRGSDVLLRGIKIGEVRDIRFAFDNDSGEIWIPVTIEITPEIAGVSGSESSPYEGIDELVAAGLRGQLASANLITGQLLVSLDIHPDAEPAEVDYSGVYPAIPTLPSDLDQLTASAEEILRNLAALPLDELVADARETVQAIGKVAASPELQSSLTSLDSTLARVEQQSGPILENIRKASLSAEKALVEAEALLDADKATRQELDAMLRELAAAARSIRLLADYLEQNPNALISGKTGGQ